MVPTSITDVNRCNWRMPSQLMGEGHGEEEYSL